MAVPVYQNQTPNDIIVPTADGSMSLYPYEYVGGSYYAHITELTDVTAENIADELVKYFYPGSESEGGAGGISNVTGTSPVNVSVVLGVADISLDPISASDIGSGELVKSLNGLTDTVTITGQAGISVDVNVGTNSLDITNTQLGLTDIYATAPLYLELGEGNVSLEGYIEITPTDNGGAVAIQSTIKEPERQNGLAYIAGLNLGSQSSIAYQPYYSKLLVGRTDLDMGDGGDISSTLFGTGDFNSAQYITAATGLRSTTISAYTSLNFDTTSGFITEIYNQEEVPYVSFTPEFSFIDTPLDLRQGISIGGYSPITDTYGFIDGVLTIDHIDPLIELGASENVSVPLILLRGGYPSNVYLKVVDDQENSLISLHADGVIDAKTINADTVNVTTLYADNVYTNTLYVVGPDTINITTAGGPQTVIADCSAGPVVVQLPDLTSFTRSLQLTVLKTDVTNNALSVVRGPNSYINGATEALNIVTQYTGKGLTSTGMNWYITNSVG